MSEIRDIDDLLHRISVVLQGTSHDIGEYVGAQIADVRRVVDCGSAVVHAYGAGVRGKGELLFRFAERVVQKKGSTSGLEAQESFQPHTCQLYLSFADMHARERQSHLRCLKYTIIPDPVMTTAPRIIQKSPGKPRIGLWTVSIWRMETIRARGKVRSAMMVSTRIVSFSFVERSELLVSRSSWRKSVRRVIWLCTR